MRLDLKQFDKEYKIVRKKIVEILDGGGYSEEYKKGFLKRFREDILSLVENSYKKPPTVRRHEANILRFEGDNSVKAINLGQDNSEL